ncbi:biliverdin-producing heme oxygenase [Hymenobacter arizonensis]|uniref:Heme oxygenase n=1 Tax=Hymenobacter arizonensis TaxID=1227077 RepID=A0A1I5ZB19_HYMAR|nr:biliverdin-producing heme oxygenase [Hymenobacter arizonensis]SFQ53620.1 Heme oxygenase [Hymenobacter arizonensis]
MTEAVAPITLLQRLRTETRPSHDAVEQNGFAQSMRAGTLTLATTQYFLAKMYGFLKPYEDRLQEFSWAPAWEIERRLRAHLILSDLESGPDAAALPLCPAMPPLHTRAELLGAMYVLEGSTLGGQVISRELAKAGISARTYFEGNRERTGPLWKSFCHLLSEAAVEEDDNDIVLSARRTFEHLEAWLNHE